MKILITCPSWAVPHGGIRIILEWANRLTQWHEVYLYNLKADGPCTWFNISDSVQLAGVANMFQMDTLIITSPHSIHLQDHPDRPRKVFIFMQMAEHMFRPEDKAWVDRCWDFYTSPHPLICISKWNQEEISGPGGRSGPTYLVSNGVNLDDFPIDNKKKDGKTVLVEGLFSSNPSKDRDGIGFQVASKLKQEGYRIAGYSQNKPSYQCRQMFHEFYWQPSLGQMNDLYSRATIMVKATRFDARSCAPMEAMTKGTVTARAIMKGDDDLIDGYNCLRAPYNAHYLYSAAKELLTNHHLRDELARNGFEHLKQNSWIIWMDRINNILSA
jgi:hypothetical protein